MAASNLRHTASLRSFLLSGELGPLSFDLTMLQVSTLLGPPSWWVTDVGDELVPLYWGYFNHLELGFSPEPPYRLESLKLRNFPQPEKKFVQICKSLRLTGDGMSSDLSPAQVLRQEIWNTDDVTVGISHGWNPVIDICTPRVRLVWSMNSEGEEVFEKHHIAGLSKARSIVLREQLSTGFFGVYSMADPKADRLPPETWEDFTVAEFLALLDHDADPTPKL